MRFFVIFLFFLSVVSASDWIKLGVETNSTFAEVKISLVVDEVRCVLGEKDLALDHLFYEEEIIEPFYWYVGYGLFFDYDYIHAGARLIFGIDVYIQEFLDIYVETSAFYDIANIDMLQGKYAAGVRILF